MQGLVNRRAIERKLFEKSPLKRAFFNLFLLDHLFYLYKCVCTLNPGLFL